MARQQLGGDTGRAAAPSPRGRVAAGRPARSPGAVRVRALAAATALLALPLAACAGEEPSTEAPDPGAPITRSPS